MIKNMDGNIFDSSANFIVHSYGNIGFMDDYIEENYPHVVKESLKYIRHCKKNHIEMLESVQYIPTEVWPIGWVDTMKNNNVIAFDNPYQYIVNLFCQKNSEDGILTDLKAMKKVLTDIREKAQDINATVAIPYKIGFGDWNNIYNLIKKVFEKSDIDVEIWR